MTNEELLLYLSESLVRARGHIKAKQWHEATDLVMIAIERLGDKYRLPKPNRDDTSQRISFAKRSEERGDVEEACKLCYGALSSRYEAFESKITAQRMCEHADKALEKAEAFLSQSEFQNANACLTTALREIGNRYCDGIIEPSNTSIDQLAVAEDKEKNDDLLGACDLRMEALKYRRGCLFDKYLEMPIKIA